jgi:nucleoside 2-deoxyribosyltransferase
MKVYLAAAYPRRFGMRQYRAELAQHGWAVTARWIDQDFDDDAPAEAELAGFASNNLDDLHAADAAVFFTSDPSTRGGMWVEFGYALAMGKAILVLGPHVNVFTRLVDRVETWPAVIDWLEERT